MKLSKGIILSGIVLSGMIFIYPLIKMPKYSTKVCSQFKTLFWKTSLTQKLKSSEVECLQKDEKQKGLGSYFVPQNFENLRCPAKQIGFAKSTMPQVTCFVISSQVFRYILSRDNFVISAWEFLVWKVNFKAKMLTL